MLKNKLGKVSGHCWLKISLLYVSGIPVHLHFALIDRLLLAVGRNHPPDLSSCAITGEVCALHNDT